MNVFYLPNEQSIEEAKELWRNLDSEFSSGSLSYVDDEHQTVRVAQSTFKKVLESAKHNSTIILWDLSLIKMKMSEFNDIMSRMENRGVLVRILNPDYLLDPSTPNCRRTISLLSKMEDAGKAYKNSYAHLRNEGGYGFKVIGDELKELLKKARREGKTLKEISIEFGVSVPTISKYTKGIRAIKKEQTKVKVKRDRKVFDYDVIDSLSISDKRLKEIVREFIKLQRRYETKKSYYSDLRRFFRWNKATGERIQLVEDIILNFGLEYKAFLEKEGYKAGGIRRYMSTLVTFLNYCVKLGYVSNNPISAIKLPKARRHSVSTHKIEDSDLELILKTSYAQTQKEFKRASSEMIAHRNFLLLYLLSTTGARSGALLSLRLMDITRTERVMYISLESKTDDSYQISVDENSRNLIEKYIKHYFFDKEEDAFLFFHSEDNYYNPMTSSALSNILSRTIKKADIDTKDKNITPHSFRTTYASNQYFRAKKSLKEIQKRLNHKNINQTAAYLQFKDVETTTDWMPNIADFSSNFSGV